MVSTRLLSLLAQGVSTGLFGFVWRPESSPTSAVVDLGYAKYEGNPTYPDTVAYLGIPYAEPPLGERRWRKPVSLNTTRVSRETGGHAVNATTYPEFCVQGSTGSGEAGGAGTEDCLKVNIYAPAGAKEGDNLPVLFYIHGGAYAYGNPANWPFDHWVHQSPNVVIASIYYRLDSFGFLATPGMASQGLGDPNAGFYDQIEALRWVQQHISAFGGDPLRITINGESAGASSVELHLVSRESQSMFSQAIIQSVYRTPLPLLEQQEPMFAYYANEAGCGSGSLDEKMSCLRKAGVSALSRAQDAVMYNFTGPYSTFRPVIDNQLFTEYPSISIAKEAFANVPLIVGSTSNETLSFGTNNITKALHDYFPQLTQTDLEEYLDVYPSSDFDSDAQRFQVATGESDIICARHIIGLAAAKRTKAYTYRYNQPVVNATVVGHAAENWMFFRGTSTGFNGTTTFQPQSELDRTFAEELIAYWLSFVRDGDPNAFKLDRSPVWPKYTTAGQMRIVLQELKTNDYVTSGSYIEQEPRLESGRCEFVASKAERQQA